MSNKNQSDQPSVDTQTTELHWTAIGRTYSKSGTVVTPQRNQPIPIKECARSVSMDNDKDAYGQPIDARLGIYLIKNLFDQLRHSNLDVLLDNDFRARNRCKDDGQSDNRNLLCWLEGLLWHSMAITVDKNILLKALSQPLCEGLRFYLCLTPPDTAERETAGSLPNGTFSFVIVGVDCDGCDLHYSYDSSFVSKDHDVPEVGTTSLVGEYGHPPGSGVGDYVGKPEESPYVLWAYANEQFKAELAND